MGLHEMSVMDRTGHLTVKWNPEKDDEVEVARSTFDQMRAKGYSAFEVGDNGKQGPALKRFDPDVEEMIMVPPLQGG